MDTKKTICPVCDGHGRYETYLYKMNRKRLSTVTCAHCSGTGLVPKERKQS